MKRLICWLFDHKLVPIKYAPGEREALMQEWFDNYPILDYPKVWHCERCGEYK